MAEHLGILSYHCSSVKFFFYNFASIRQTQERILGLHIDHSVQEISIGGLHQWTDILPVSELRSDDRPPIDLMGLYGFRCPVGGLSSRRGFQQARKVLWPFMIEKSLDAVASLGPVDQDTAYIYM